MKRLFKIWRVQHNVTKPPAKPIFYKSDMTYDPEKQTSAYPYVEVINILPDRIRRENLVNIDRKKLEKFAKYLNEMSESDVSYEVREDVGAWERHVADSHNEPRVEG